MEKSILDFKPGELIRILGNWYLVCGHPMDEGTGIVMLVILIPGLKYLQLFCFDRRDTFEYQEGRT